MRLSIVCSIAVVGISTAALAQVAANPAHRSTPANDIGVAENSLAAPPANEAAAANTMATPAANAADAAPPAGDAGSTTGAPPKR